MNLNKEQIIIEPIDKIKIDRGTQFIEYKGNHFKLYKHCYGFNLTNITQAGLKGQVCKIINVWVLRDNLESRLQYAWFDDLLSPKREDLFNLMSLPIAKDIEDKLSALINNKTFGLALEEEKAIRVFPDHDLKRLKPLKKNPDKWNLSLALRAIINGQYKDLICEGQYSDDIYMMLLSIIRREK